MADATIQREAESREDEAVGGPAALRRAAAQAEAGGESREPSTLERALAIAGTVLFPLGLVLIGFGWYGTAHTPFVFEQMPYLVSGGLLGLSLTIAGGMLYFGSWLAALSRREQQDARELQATLVELCERLESRAPADAPEVAAVRHGPNGRRLLATPTGSMMHRPDCSVVADRDDLHEVAADEKGMSPCKLCEPLEG